MTRTEDRLTDALTAAARAIPEDTLRPLVAPPARRRRPAWITPLAAALGIVLVVGLALAAGTRLSGARPPAARRPQTPVPRYYVVEGDQGGAPVVRSTATGQVTATVPVPKRANVGVFDVLASTRGGVFFVAAAAPGTEGQRLYRFRLTSSGQVSGFAPVPGGAIGRHYWGRGRPGRLAGRVTGRCLRRLHLDRLLHDVRRCRPAGLPPGNAAA